MARLTMRWEKTMTVRPDRWATVERLYHAAQALPAEQRAPFLAEACAGDDELRREVEIAAGAVRVSR